MFSDDVWSENAALFERLMEIHSNPPILYYGFKTVLSKCSISFKIMWLFENLFAYQQYLEQGLTYDFKHESLYMTILNPLKMI